MSDQAPPPAWYPDPSGRFELRYWNGTAWTDQAARGGQVVADPLQPVTAVVAEERAAQPSQPPDEPRALPAGAVITCLSDRVPGKPDHDGWFGALARWAGNLHAFALTVDLWQLATSGLIRLTLADHHLRRDEVVVVIDDLARFDASRDRFDDPVRSFLAALRKRAVKDDGSLEPQNSSGWIGALLYDTDAASFGLGETYDGALERAGVLGQAIPDQPRAKDPARIAALQPEFDRLMAGWHEFETSQPAVAHALHREIADGLKNRWWSD